MMAHIITVQCMIEKKEFFVPKNVLLKQWCYEGLSRLSNINEVCLRIVDSQEIQMLNHTYRKKNAPTNVLSFPSELPDNIPQDTHYLGDIVLCAEIINQEAQEQHKTHEAHWAHMVLHGLLHLQGYDHLQEEEAVVMEALEVQLLEKLGFANPYTVGEALVATPVGQAQGLPLQKSNE